MSHKCSFTCSAAEHFATQPTYVIRNAVTGLTYWVVDGAADVGAVDGRNKGEVLPVFPLQVVKVLVSGSTVPKREEDRVVFSRHKTEEDPFEREIPSQFLPIKIKKYIEALFFYGVP